MSHHPGTNRPQSLPPTAKLNLGQLEKGGYPHFMLKEIFEQPGCIHDCMRGRITVSYTHLAAREYPGCVLWAVGA